MGIRAVVATGEQGDRSRIAARAPALHHRGNLHAAVTKLVNAAFAARDTAWWGQCTACVSDSRKFGS